MTQPTNSENTPPIQQNSDKEMNFAAIRKELERERQERQRAEARIAEVEKIAQERFQKAENSEEYKYDEPYVDEKYLTHKLKTFKKNHDEDIDKRVNQKVQQVLEDERRQNYLRENSDFNNIMSSEVVQKFADSHPRLAENILRMPDNFERQKLVYETIKAMGIDKPAKKEPSIQETVNQKARSIFMPQPGGNQPGYALAGDFSESGMKNAYEQMKQKQKNMRL